MSFTDKDLKRLKRIEVPNGERYLLVSSEELKAFLARLEAAEFVFNDPNNPGVYFNQKHWRQWRKACGREK